jgi:hypothetical protein
MYLFPLHCITTLELTPMSTSQIRKWEYQGELPPPPRIAASLKGNDTVRAILKNVGDMSNHIIANEASKNLARYDKQFYLEQLYTLYHSALTLSAIIQITTTISRVL